MRAVERVPADDDLAPEQSGPQIADPTGLIDPQYRTVSLDAVHYALMGSIRASGRDSFRLGKGANMRAVRFSIAGLMGVVLVAAIGLAALRSQSQIWAGVLLLSTLAAFCVALVGAFCRRGAARGGWIGFAVFGWSYMSAAFLAV